VCVRRLTSRLRSRPDASERDHVGRLSRTRCCARARLERLTATAREQDADYAEEAPHVLLRRQRRYGIEYS
jgi:hypothetical protein